MSLYKRGKIWCIDYRYPPGRDGKRIREPVGPDKNEARIVLAERLKDIRQGRNPELRRILEHYQASLEDAVEQVSVRGRCRRTNRVDQRSRATAKAAHDPGG